jgi:hypothetical protein
MSTLQSRKKTGAAAAVGAARPMSKNQGKRKKIQEHAPEVRPIIKAVPLLLERFPQPDKEWICLGLHAPDAQEVFVAGSFNGWQGSAMPLQKQDGGHWVVELALAPGRYEYRFLVDGRWTDDPMAPAYVSNPFGGRNCVLLAGDHATIVRTI